MVPSVQGDCDRKEQGGCGLDELWHGVWCEGVVEDRPLHLGEPRQKQGMHSGQTVKTKTEKPRKKKH